LIAKLFSPNPGEKAHMGNQTDSIGIPTENTVIHQAAEGLVAEASPPRPFVARHRQRFSLTAKQVCDAIRLANNLRRAK
jgi:hypothetical protein